MLNEPSSQLRRVLGLKDLVLMIIGTVIGSGIFLVPGAVLKFVGNSVPMAAAIWFLGGVLSLLGALTYGELSATRPQAGGLYVFIRDGFGALPAFLFGWTFLLVISAGTVATLAVAFASYLGGFIPLAPWATKAIAVAMIVLITAVNIRGTRQSANLTNVTTAIKVIVIIGLGIVLCIYGKFSPWSSDASLAPAGFGLSGIGLAMISVLWAYEGWQYVTFNAGETINPQRTVPLALLVGTVTLILIYLLANAGYVAALGAAGVANSEQVAASALDTVAGGRAARLIGSVILVSMFSAANATMLSTPRLFYAMANDGLFFRALARVHPTLGTPANAIAAAGAWSALLAALGSFEQLLTFVVFIGWIFYALAAASVFVYRRREPDAIRTYRVPGYPITPIVFILAAMGLVVNTVISQPLRAAIGLGIVLLGVPAYSYWRSRTEILAANTANASESTTKSKI
jgi:APA family basic amino acid/polyamine antiporter